MVKLFCNVQRDVTFALANHFALISEALGLDIAEIEHAATAAYPRFHLSRPGPVGGPCLPKDTLLLDLSVDGRHNSPALALTARQVNLFVLDHVLVAIADHLAETAPANPVIAVLGLAFKGDPPTRTRAAGSGPRSPNGFEPGGPKPRSERGIQARTKMSTSVPSYVTRISPCSPTSIR